MFGKSRVVVSSLLVALALVSISDSASQAFARGGGGGRGGRAHSMSRAGGSRSTRSSRGPSNRKAYAHKQQHNKQQHNKQQHNKQNNKHHHRHHGRYGWGDGADGDGGYFDGADASYAVDPVAAPITILNPAETGRTVSYTLGSTAYSIEPSRSLAHNDGTQVIAFDRGTLFGQASYTLQPGTYRFVMTNTGWDLRAVSELMAANSAAYPE